ncbi:MAG: hypothetical protein GX227_05565 [Clostridiaceae bacterium]|jgi:hypothetical protein|nr:hypothetical protein [Clostridiaceae bacterium]
MKHLFSSGEVMLKKNSRELPEGILVGKFLEYEKVEPDTKFYCTGLLNNKEVKVSFVLSENDFDGIKTRKNFGILMQSDIFLAEWASYKIHD